MSVRRRFNADSGYRQLCFDAGQQKLFAVAR